MVTPVALNGAGCATAPVAVRAEATSSAASSLVFMNPSQLSRIGGGPASCGRKRPRLTLARALGVAKWGGRRDTPSARLRGHLPPQGRKGFDALPVNLLARAAACAF